MFVKVLIEKKNEMNDTNDMNNMNDLRVIEYEYNELELNSAIFLNLRNCSWEETGTQILL